jgi:hypothetical protein
VRVGKGAKTKRKAFVKPFEGVGTALEWLERSLNSAKTALQPSDLPFKRVPAGVQPSRLDFPAVGAGQIHCTIWIS